MTTLVLGSFLQKAITLSAVLRDTVRKESWLYQGNAFEKLGEGSVPVQAGVY